VLINAGYPDAFIEVWGFRVRGELFISLLPQFRQGEIGKKSEVFSNNHGYVGVLLSSKHT